MTIKSHDQNLLTVVISTYNRACKLPDVLAALSKQCHDQFTYEVIVIDNYSDDDTAAVVRTLQRAYPVPLHYTFEPRRGKAFALNHALMLANGDFLVFTDDDTAMDAQWLSKTYQTFKEYEADGVGGPVHPQWISPPPRWLSNRLLRQIGIADHGAEPFVVTNLKTPFIGPNCAYRRSLFERLGGFNTTPGCAEDAEWFARALRSGAKLIYQPKAVVFHKLDGQRITKRAIAQRFFRNGTFAGTGWEGRALFGIPLWVTRYFLSLHGQAAWAWLQGKRDEALWHWLRRYYYWGILSSKANSRKWIR